MKHMDMAHAAAKLRQSCSLCEGTGWLHGAQEWTPERMRKGTPYKSVRCTHEAPMDCAQAIEREAK